MAGQSGQDNPPPLPGNSRRVETSEPKQAGATSPNKAGWLRKWFWAPVKNNENWAQTVFRVLGNLCRTGLTIFAGICLVAGVGMAAVSLFAERNSPVRIQAWIQSPIECSEDGLPKTATFFVVNPTSKVLGGVTILVHDESRPTEHVKFDYDVAVPPNSINVQDADINSLLTANDGVSCDDVGQVNPWYSAPVRNEGDEFAEYLAEMDARQAQKIWSQLPDYVEGKMEAKDASWFEELFKRGLDMDADLEQMLTEVERKLDDATSAEDSADKQSLALTAARLRKLIHIRLEGKLIRTLRNGDLVQVDMQLSEIKRRFPEHRYAINRDKGIVLRDGDQGWYAIDGVRLALSISQSYGESPTLVDQKTWKGIYRKNQISVPIKDIEITKLLEKVPAYQISDPHIFSKSQQAEIREKLRPQEWTREDAEGYDDWTTK